MDGTGSFPKKRAHVRVYEALYGMLCDGATFPVGSRLPAEPKLAAMLGVSRMTLRQALALLQEDGMITPVQGSGTYVTDRNRSGSAGLELLGSPVRKCLAHPGLQVQLDWHTEVPNTYMLHQFGPELVQVFVVNIWYHLGEELCAHTLALGDQALLETLGLSAAEDDGVLAFLEEGIYRHAVRAHMDIQLTRSDVVSPQGYGFAERDCLLLLEHVYQEDALTPLLCSKHYLAPSRAVININALSGK